jgi:hypothetical protein
VSMPVCVGILVNVRVYGRSPYLCPCLLSFHVYNHTLVYVHDVLLDVYVHEV